ncbi:YEATS domain-containing protein 2, partial [Blattella germanica]
RAEVSQRVYGIISREFGAELAKREKEVLEIQDRLQEAHKSLHALRFAVVSAFYNKKQNTTDEKQKPIHPAVKKLIGKEPRNWEPLNQRPSKYRPLQGNPLPEPILQDLQPVTKVPRYIPPKMPPRSTPLVPTSFVEMIVIGNISKWVPVDTREDSASHKWMMYVRGPKESPDVSGFVSKVRFFLHPSYRPNDIAEVTAPPFHLSRRGWGEFPVRVQIHFTQSQNKPVDLIHHLKLDRTYTGLQTLGEHEKLANSVKPM